MRLRPFWPSTERRPTLILLGIIAVGLVTIACTRKADVSDAGSATSANAYDETLKHRVSVSGISSGGYMAVQTHVALADRIGGAGIAAAGPYHCAEGNVRLALGRCLSGEALDAEPFIEFARRASASGRIAPLDALESARVWIFHSPEDAVVAPATSGVLQTFYAAFVPAEQIEVVDDVGAAHGWPTDDFGVACNEMGADFINNCGFDAAGVLLSHVYGALEAAAEPTSPVAVDLAAYFSPDANIAGEGFAYVPPDCTDGKNDCRLHIVFHGCRQGADFLGDRFARHAGYNEWAASNRIVIVYPQVEKSLFNPQGCWDWWGYTDAAYDTQSGLQIAGIGRLIDAFADGSFPIP